MTPHGSRGSAGAVSVSEVLNAKSQPRTRRAHTHATPTREPDGPDTPQAQARDHTRNTDTRKHPPNRPHSHTHTHTSRYHAPSSRGGNPGPLHIALTRTRRHAHVPDRLYSTWNGGSPPYRWFWSVFSEHAEARIGVRVLRLSENVEHVEATFRIHVAINIQHVSNILLGGGEPPPVTPDQ